MNTQFFRLTILIITSMFLLFLSCRKDKMTDKPDDVLDEHESKIELPQGGDLTIDDITLYGSGGNEINKSKKGGFTTSSNSLIAVNKEYEIVYISYLSTDTLQNDKKVILNSEETAVSLLLQVLPNVFDVASVEKFQILKKLIKELPETKSLSKSIDNSIVKNGYLEFNDVEQEYKLAVDKIVELTGLKDNFLNSNTKKQRNLKSAKSLKLPKLPYNSANGIRLDLVDSKYIKEESVWRCKFTGYCDRFSYIAFVHGRIGEDGKAYPSYTSFKEQMRYLAPPMNVSAFMDKTSSWEGIKEYFADTWKLMTKKDFGFADMTWDMTKVEDIYMDFKTKEDVIIAYAPADNKNVLIYNTVIAFFSPVLTLISENAGSDKESFVKTFAKEFGAELITDDIFMKSFFYVVSDNNLSAKNKVVKIYNLIRPKFIDYVTNSAIEALPEIAKAMANKAMKKALTDVNFYTKAISITGDIIFSYLGYTQKSLAFPIELYFPEKLSLSKKHVIVKGGKVVELTITSGSGKYTASSDNTAIATANINGNNVKIKGITEGKTTITITDTETEYTEKIIAIVTAATPDLALAQSTASLQIGKQITIAITAGSGKYTAVSSNTDITIASISGSNVQINGIAEGSATVTVTDTETEQTVNISVSVTNNSSVSFEDNFDDNNFNKKLWHKWVDGTEEDIREEDGIMKIEQNKTDKRTTLKSKNYPFKNVVTFERDVFIHSHPNYWDGYNHWYYGCSHLRTDDEKEFLIRYYKTNHYDDDWQKETLEGIYLEYNKKRIFMHASIFDKWFKEKVEVDKNTKSIRYYINNKLVYDTYLDIDFSNSQNFTLYFNSYGWWTGHKQYMDNFKLTY